MQGVDGAQSVEHGAIGLVNGVHDEEDAADVFAFNSDGEDKEQGRAIFQEPGDEVVSIVVELLVGIVEPLGAVAGEDAGEAIAAGRGGGMLGELELAAGEHTGDLECPASGTEEDAHAPGRDQPAGVLTNGRPEGLEAILGGKGEDRLVQGAEGEAADGDLEFSGLSISEDGVLHYVPSSPSISMALTSDQVLMKLVKAAVMATSMISPSLSP